MRVLSINHVCLVVRNRAVAEQFYMRILGLTRHHARETWLVLSPTSTLHLVEIPEAKPDDSLFHQVQHFALQVDSVELALALLLKANLKPFQMDFDGNESPVSDIADPLSFGLGTLFVHDPDGNLVEFIEEGRGLYQVDMRPR